jgi:cell division protease FtsH
VAAASAIGWAILARPGAVVPPGPDPISYTAFVQAIDAGDVESLSIQPGHEIRGVFRETAESGATAFAVTWPIGDVAAIANRAAGNGVDVSFRTVPVAGRVQRAVMLGLQIGLIGALFAFLFLVLRGQGFGTRVGAKAGHGDVTLSDVAGTQGSAEELREVVDFLSDPGSFRAMGARVPKGVLLFGPPGTGKTLLARAVAGEAKVPFFHLSGSEVTGFVVGLGAHRIRTLFARARKHGGVIFIDEIDALGSSRGSNRSHNEDDRTLNQLLVEMDGFEPSTGVVVIGATNRPDDLDPALKRPGRFDRFVSIGLPTADGREAILRLHADRREMPLAEDVDFARLARLTPRSSGADLANLINEAAIAAVREKRDRVAWSHFEIARDRIMLGKERVGFRAAEREWRTVAWHEAGHAIAGVVATPEDGLHKVTIQPRGQAMGVAHFAPDDDQHLHSRAYLEAQIIKGLGGRVAEALKFGGDNVTGGAESDLVHVNRIARQMVDRLGMGDDSGLLIYDPEAPLGESTRARMDDEVRAMLDRLQSRTREILRTYSDALDALAEALLERETLEGDDAVRLLAAHGVPVGVKADRAHSVRPRAGADASVNRAAPFTPAPVSTRPRSSAARS